MDSILNAAAATNRNLVGNDRMLSELGVTGPAANLLQAVIAEASAAIESYLGRPLIRTTATETFYPENYEQPGRLMLSLRPVSTLTSVTLDGTLLGASDYASDANAGHLYRLDGSGYRTRWDFGKSVVVVYAGGYIPPDDENRTLPFDIEQATARLVSSFWLAKGRDAALKVEDIPGVLRREYWVAGSAAPGLPPEVTALLAPYRRIFV